MNPVSSSRNTTTRPLPSVNVRVRGAAPLLAADIVAADLYATMHESGMDGVRIDLVEPSPGSFVWEIRYRDLSGRGFKSELDRPSGEHTPISRALLGLQHRVDDATVRAEAAA
jgi:hypothetical protein